MLFINGSFWWHVFAFLFTLHCYTHRRSNHMLFASLFHFTLRDYCPFQWGSVSYRMNRFWKAWWCWWWDETENTSSDEWQNSFQSDPLSINCKQYTCNIRYASAYHFLVIQSTSLPCCSRIKNLDCEMGFVCKYVTRTHTHSHKPPTSPHILINFLIGSFYNKIRHKSLNIYRKSGKWMWVLIDGAAIVVVAANTITIHEARFTSTPPFYCNDLDP